MQNENLLNILQKKFAFVITQYFGYSYSFQTLQVPLQMCVYLFLASHDSLNFQVLGKPTLYVYYEKSKSICMVSSSYLCCKINIKGRHRHVNYSETFYQLLNVNILTRNP